MTTIDAMTPFLNYVKQRDPDQPEFLQTVTEILHSLWPYLEANPRFKSNALLERLVEPERIITFRVPWQDDQGQVHVNRGYRAEMSSAIGPYKGGLRFHPALTLDTLKSLALEQTLKNALTSLPMGGAKGGADFDPKGKSENEIMRFCQSFMLELSRHIGQYTDIPAGDIGVGQREVGYMYGQFKRLRNEFSGVFTGKNIEFGGSLIRPEATGYGCVYFVEEMLATRKDSLAGKTVAISGAGNVAQYAAQKLIECDAKVISVSDSLGCVHLPHGMTAQQLAALLELKNERREPLSTYAKEQDLPYYHQQRPWQFSCAIAMPCATQNELDKDDAKTLLKNGCLCVAEGANIPSTPEAVALFHQAKILYGPGKAANAGGVAVSGLEMSQNSLRLSWTSEEVDHRLKEIMRCIHEACVCYGQQAKHYTNYVNGANIAGFNKVANAMLAQGVV